MGAAMLLLLMLQAQNSESSGARPGRTDRTWSLWVHLESCELTIERVDTMRIGVENSTATVTAGKLLIFQWNHPNPGAANLSLGGLLAEMSKVRYKARVFYRRPDGTSGVSFLYFSPYGAALEPIEQLEPYDSDAEGDAERTLLSTNRWKAAHDFSPRSQYNPEQTAFETEFRKLSWRLDARMEMKIRIGGCPTSGQTRIGFDRAQIGR